MLKDIIVFGEDWGKLPSSTQHLIKYLGTDRKIIWVNSIGLRQPSWGWQDLRRLWEKLISRTHTDSSSTKLNSTHFQVISPKTIPAPKSALMRKIARKLLRKQILPVMQEMNISAPILWTSLPTAVDTLGVFDEAQVVYYCGDDFSALAGVDHNVVPQREAELVTKADLVLAASKTLTKKFANENANTHYIPHGVDYELFSEPTDIAKNLPQGKPIAGFYGSISKWLDIPLLLCVIQNLPEWNFVFVGKIEVNVTALAKLDNVFFLPQIDHASLPSYSQHWQCSLLPFVDNEQIRACNPLKLREYLATGKPVVSTYFPALEPYLKFVHVATTPFELEEAISACQDSTINTEQQALVQTESWLYRAQQVQALLVNDE